MSPEVSELFGPDVPGAEPDRYVVAQGERALMAALLEDAVHCYVRERPFRGCTTEFLQAEAWLLSEEMRWGSFLYVCEVLKLDAGQIRRRITGRKV